MNVYLIYGSDYSIIKREIHKITNGINDVVKYDLSIDKVDVMLDDASCISLFGDKKVLVGENALFLTTTPSNVNHDFDYLERYLLDDNHNNIVIFSVISDKLDERKKIVKLLKNNSKVIHKQVIDEKQLPNFVVTEFQNEGYYIDYDTACYFVNYVGKNVDILLSEINKMIIYKDNEKKINIDDINSVNSKSFNDNVFDLCDGIMKKDYKKIYDCYNDLMTLKEEPIKIIVLLGNQFILIYQCKLLYNSGMSEKEIADYLKVHPYRVKLALQTNYLIYEIEDIIKKLHNLDYDIKSGKKDKNFGLDDFLLHL